jgi:TonB family protein
MSEENKKGNNRLSDYFRYRKNKMTARERNTFERNLQKDPFALEASEGLENIDPLLARKDISRLRKQIIKSTGRKQRVVWYRIAASVAVLMIISSVIFLLNKRGPSGQLSYAPVTEQSNDLQTLKEQPVTETYVQNPAVEKKLPSPSGPERIIKPQSETIKDEIKSDEKREKVRADVSVENIEIMEAAKAAETNQVLAADKALQAKSARIMKTSDTISVFKSDTSDISLNEVVVVGYGARRAGNEAEEDVNQYNPPYPAGGKPAFDRYVRENIRRPDTTTGGQRVVVVINFSVSNEGKIDSIRIIRSPGKSFSDEAIRLIREGPEWKPAEENGKAINDEVRIRIVFK